MISALRNSAFHAAGRDRRLRLAITKREASNPGAPWGAAK